MTYTTYRDLGRRRTVSGVLAAFGTVFGRLGEALATWRARRERRDAFANLLGYDDRMLADMGVIRGDVEWAMGLPLHVDAARALDDRRVARQIAEERVRSRGRGDARRLDRVYREEVRRIGVPR